MEKGEGSIIKLLKIVFAIIAVISIIFVFYNIGIYTDNQGIEASSASEKVL
jgi:hypothetical protein